MSHHGSQESKHYLDHLDNAEAKAGLQSLPGIPPKNEKCIHQTIAYSDLYSDLNSFKQLTIYSLTLLKEKMDKGERSFRKS